MPDEPVCDFCRATPVVATYPCRDFSHRATEFTFNSAGGWAACETCLDLIERGARGDLAWRSAVTHPERRFVPVPTLARRVRSLHDTFWSNRLGPPLRHDAGLQHDPTT